MLRSAIPILASIDQAGTIEFYKSKLGFTFHSGWDGYLIFSRDDIFIHLWPTSDTEIPKNTGCFVNVTKIEKLYTEFSEAGCVHPNGKLELKPWSMKQFSVLDNNGNIIHFGESLPKSS